MSHLSCLTQTHIRHGIQPALQPAKQESLDVGVVMPFDPNDDPEKDESAINSQVGHVVPPEFKSTGYKSPPPQTKGFAAATAAATGQTKRTTNRALARAKVLTDDDLDKLTNTITR